MWYLCSGKTGQNHRLTQWRRRVAGFVMLGVAEQEASRMCAMPVGAPSPWRWPSGRGHHSHVDAICLAVSIMLWESSRGGSKRGSTPRNCHCSCHRAGHTKGTEATSGKLVHRLLDLRLNWLRLAQSENNLRAPFVTLKA